LKQLPAEADFDPDCDGDCSPWREVYDELFKLPGEPFWAGLVPVRRTQFRMQMEAALQWEDFKKTMNVTVRLLRKVLRKVYYRDVASNNSPYAVSL